MDDKKQVISALPNHGQAIYNIGAVVRLTGIPITTLHAWERRYGFPGSVFRSQGGHRLYSDENIKQLLGVKELIHQGFSAHQAVISLQENKLQGQLNEDNGQTRQPKVVWPFPSIGTNGRLIDSLLENDLLSADRILGELLAFHSPENLIKDEFGPAFREIGQAWMEGRISVATEHMASNYLRQRLLAWLVNSPPPRRDKPVVLACAPGELHEGSLLMMAVLLRRQGWPVAYLGQDVPFKHLKDILGELNACALLLVAITQDAGQKLVDWPDHLQGLDDQTIVTSAGRAFVEYPELKGLVKGEYLGDDLESGLKRLMDLIYH